MAEPLKSKKQKASLAHLRSIAALGGKARYEKYGSVAIDEKKRKRAWKAWWEREGKHKSTDILARRAIKRPPHSARLAEFVGIMIGDGGVTEYFITITLNSQSDLKYAGVVATLIEDLFGVSPKIRHRKRGVALDVVVHRKELALFCIEVGLKKGNKLKQGLDIPSWIKQNPVYAKACLRGLFDTDGSWYLHRYTSKGKIYEYQKISFSSRSSRLIRTVHTLLDTFCIKSEIAYNGVEVRIQNQEYIKKFVQHIGSNNPKNKKRVDIRRGD